MGLCLKYTVPHIWPTQVCPRFGRVVEATQKQELFCVCCKEDSANSPILEQASDGSTGLECRLWYSSPLVGCVNRDVLGPTWEFLEIRRPEHRPQVVGLLLERHPQKRPPMYRNSHLFLNRLSLARSRGGILRLKAAAAKPPRRLARRAEVFWVTLADCNMRYHN